MAYFELNEEQQEVYWAIIGNYDNDNGRALRMVEDGDYLIYCDCFDMSDVAYEIANELGYIDKIPDHLRSYFDYEAFGRDLDIEGYFIYMGSGRYLQLLI